MLQEHVEKAIALNPKDPTNYYLLGRWWYGVRNAVVHLAFSKSSGKNGSQLHTVQL